MDIDTITANGASNYMYARYFQKADTLDSTHNKIELDICLIEMKEGPSLSKFSHIGLVER